MVLRHAIQNHVWREHLGNVVAVVVLGTQQVVGASLLKDEEGGPDSQDPQSCARRQLQRRARAADVAANADGEKEDEKNGDALCLRKV